jgi:ParB family chromosome partitioning protein
VGKDTAKAAHTAAKSSVALEALESQQISLTEAAVLTEFEQDGSEAVDRLVAAAGTPQFDHVMAELRSERASAQARAEAIAHYTERGFAILDDGDRWGWKLDRVPLRHLQRDGDDGEPEGVDDTVITDPQHWAVRLEEYIEYADSDGNVVDEDQIDWDTEGDPEAEPAEGLRHADHVVERTAFTPDWFCLNPEAAGLQVSVMYQRNAQWSARDRSGESHTVTTDLDREAARLRAEAEQAEAKKRERRIVVTLNKLGAAASGVRRAWVATLLSRKTLPRGAATFVADCLARDSYMLTQQNRDEVTAELLGIDAAAVHQAVSDLPEGSDNRAMVIALALVLASLEGRTGKDAWRHPAPVREPGDDRIYYGHSVTSGDYLRFLAANGYTLSAVEKS